MYLLAYLHGATLARQAPPSIGAVADWLGMDPTTLNRNPKPLIARGLVCSASDPADGRVRIVRTTDKGARALARAVPLRQQAQVEQALGPEATAALNDLLDLSSGRLRPAAERPETARPKGQSHRAE